MRGHIYKRGTAWTVMYDEGRDADGRRIQRSKGGFATRRARFLTDTLSRLGDGSYAAPSKLTVAEFLNEEWLPAIEGTLRPLSVTQYRSVVRLRIIPTLGHLRLQTLSGGHLNALYRELEQAGLSASTRRLTHAVLSRSLRDAVRWGKLVRNPAAAADPPAPAESRATAWTAKELSRFVAHVDGDRLFALWRLAATTGMRRGELLGLSWLALDLDGARLTVDRQLVPTRGGVTFGPPKSKRSRRSLALDADTVDVLRGHREAQLLERELAGDAYADHDLVFADELRPPRPSAASNGGLRAPPEGCRAHDRDAPRPASHALDAGADERRPRACGCRPDRRPARNGASHIRTPAAAIRRAGGRAGRRADRRLAPG